MVRLQEGEAEEKTDNHATSQPRIHMRQRRYPIKKVGSHNSFLTFSTRMDLIKARQIDLKFGGTFSSAVVHFGDIPAECIAKVVGYDQTIFCERPSEIAPQALAIQLDVLASGDRLLDEDPRQNRLNINELFSIHFATELLIIDDTMQREKSKEHSAKKEVLLKEPDKETFVDQFRSLQRIASGRYPAIIDEMFPFAKNLGVDIDMGKAAGFRVASRSNTLALGVEMIEGARKSQRALLLVPGLEWRAQWNDVSMCASVELACLLGTAVDRRGILAALLPHRPHSGTLTLLCDQESR